MGLLCLAGCFHLLYFCWLASQARRRDWALGVVGMHLICCLPLAEDQGWNFHYTCFACQKEALWFHSGGFLLNAKLGMWCSDVFQLLKATTKSRQGNIYLYTTEELRFLECGIASLRVSHIRGGSHGLEYETGSFCNPVYQALIWSEIPDSSVTILGKLILLKSSHCLTLPGRGWGMLTELMEYFLAWISFKEGDCAFDKTTFFNRKHLLTSKCCFHAKTIPQNSIVLFSEQKSKSVGVLATDFVFSNEEKDLLLKNQQAKRFFSF